MEREKTILRFIGQYIAENGWAPTYQEIADGVGLKSKSDIGAFLFALEKKGYIKKGNGPRMIALTGKGFMTSDEREAACESKSRRSACRVRRSSKR